MYRRRDLGEWERLWDIEGEGERLRGKERMREEARLKGEIARGWRGSEGWWRPCPDTHLEKADLLHAVLPGLGVHHLKYLGVRRRGAGW